jgi:hypothetical protein
MEVSVRPIAITEDLAAVGCTARVAADVNPRSAPLARALSSPAYLAKRSKQRCSITCHSEVAGGRHHGQPLGNEPRLGLLLKRKLELGIHDSLLTGSVIWSSWSLENLHFSNRYMAMKCNAPKSAENAEGCNTLKGG